MTDTTITELALMLAAAHRRARLAEERIVKAETTDEETEARLLDAEERIVELRREIDARLCARQDMEDERNEARAEVEALTVDLARVRAELAEARHALDASHGHDAATVAELRALLRDIVQGPTSPWVGTSLWRRVLDAANGGGS